MKYLFLSIVLSLSLSLSAQSQSMTPQDIDQQMIKLTYIEQSLVESEFSEASIESVLQENPELAASDDLEDQLQIKDGTAKALFTTASCVIASAACCLVAAAAVLIFESL